MSFIALPTLYIQSNRRLPAACKHLEVTGAAGEDGDAVNEAAVTSSRPVGAAGGLCAAVVVAEGDPAPVNFQDHFQVSRLLR